MNNWVWPCVFGDDNMNCSSRCITPLTISLQVVCNVQEHYFCYCFPLLSSHTRWTCRWTFAGSLSVGLVTATSCASFLRCNIMEDIFPWSSPLFVNWLLSTLSSSPHWRNQNITMLSIWHGHSPFALILLKLNYDWVTVSYGYPISQSDFALQMYIALTLTTQKLERIEHQNRTKPNFGNMIPYLNHGGQATVFCYFC